MQILDVGCGVTKRGSLGVDIDRNVRPDVVADAKALPFRDETFDKVISIQCLEHLWAPPSQPMEAVMLALKEFTRVVKEEGYLDLTVPNFAGISSLVKRITLRGEGLLGQNGPEGYFILGSHVNPNHVHHVAFTHRNLKLILNRIGLRDIKFVGTTVNSDLLRRFLFLIPKSRHDLIHVMARKIE